MEKQFDETFRQRVLAVFENYQDESAHQGWLLLKEKLPEKNKNNIAGFWMLAGAAASIAFLIGLGYIMGKVNSEHLSNYKYSHQAQETDNDGKWSKKQRSVNERSIARLPIKPYSENMFSKKEVLAKKHSFNKPSEKQLFSGLLGKKGNVSNFEQTERIEVESASSGITLKSKLNFRANIQKLKNISSGLANLEVNPDIITHYKSFIEKNPAFQISWDHLPDVKITPRRPNLQNKNHALSLEVFAGSYLSYAKGNQEKTSIGGGLSGALRIARNLKVSTGIGLSPNHLSFSAPADISGNNAKLSVKPAYQFNTYSKTSLLYDTSPMETNLGYDAAILGMEIPLTLIYEIPKRHYTAFISAGVSSDALIKQNYTFHSSTSIYQGNGTGMDRVLTNNSVNGSSGSFNFARLLNVSFGIGYPLGNQNQLIIEPFLKYPLRPAGSQQISFGYGGLNLRLNFGEQKVKR